MKTNTCHLTAISFTILILLAFSVPDDCVGQFTSNQDNSKQAPSKRDESTRGYSLPSNGTLRPVKPSDLKGIAPKQEKKLHGQRVDNLPEYIGPPAEGNQQRKNRSDQREVQDNLPSSVREGLGIIGPINLQILPGSIVVTGPNPEDVRKVELLVKELMESATKTRPKRRIVKLEKAHAEYVAKWAQHLYDRNYESRQGSVSITAKSQSEIFLVGAQSAIEEAEKIVSALDK